MAKPSPHQLSIGFEASRVQGMAPAERTKLLAILVSLLMQACTVTSEGNRDDER